MQLSSGVIQFRILEIINTDSSGKQTLLVHDPFFFKLKTCKKFTAHEHKIYLKLCVVICQGFVSVHCQEKCVVEFHRDCWSLQKSAVLDVRLDKVNCRHKVYSIM